jgi:hypothetical protein
VSGPAVNTIKRDGSRYYVHPLGGKKAVGVTSVVGMLPKPFLQYWAAKVVAQAAVAEVGTVVTLAMKDPDGAVDWLKGAPRRDTNQAAVKGTDVHELVESIARGEATPRRLHPELRAYGDGFRALCDQLEPTFLHLETTVHHARLGYMGTADWWATIDAGHFDRDHKGEPLTILGDNKTTRSGVHAEVAIQLAAYANAEVLLQPPASLVDPWTEVPAPKVDGAVVFHLRPEGAKAVPIAVHAALPHPTITHEDGSPLDVTPWDIFQALLRVHFWDKALSSQMVRGPVAAHETPETKGTKR